MDNIFITVLFTIFIFFMGGCIGSFINVLAYRIPLGKSVVMPRSACPYCNALISPLGLVPVLGYFFMGRKCKNCKEPISISYPMVEFIVAILTLLVVYRYTNPPLIYAQITGYYPGGTKMFGALKHNYFIELFSALWLLYSGVIYSLFSISMQKLPNKIVAFTVIVGLILGIFNPKVGWLSSLVGGVVLNVFILIFMAVYAKVRKIKGMEFSEVKYLILLGVTLGWLGVVWGVAVSSVLGILVGIPLTIIKKEVFEELPFGPFIAAAALVIATFGEQIQDFVYPPQMDEVNESRSPILGD